MTTRDEREAALEAAGFNLFTLHAEDVLIDLLTDSGTGAMSRDQWAAIQRGDESLRRLAVVVRVPRGGPGAVPVPRTSSRPTRAGPPRRSCSRVLGGPGKVVPNNTHFDTTRANVEFTGAEARRPRHRRGPRPVGDPPVQGQHGRRARSTRCSTSAATDVPVVFVTVTNNSRRRPAGVAGEPARGPRGLRPPRRAAVPRRLPVRRERLVHQAARAGPGATVRSPTSSARWRRSPTA